MTVDYLIYILVLVQGVKNPKEFNIKGELIEGKFLLSILLP